MQLKEAAQLLMLDAEQLKEHEPFDFGDDQVEEWLRTKYGLDPGEVYDLAKTRGEDVLKMMETMPGGLGQREIKILMLSIFASVWIEGLQIGVLYQRSKNFLSDEDDSF